MAPLHRQQRVVELPRQGWFERLLNRYIGWYDMAEDSKVNACPWFDRVDTKSNPVDGLSRGDFNGNWDIVPLLFPGAEVSAAYRRARRYAPS